MRLLKNICGIIVAFCLTACSTNDKFTDYGDEEITSGDLTGQPIKIGTRSPENPTNDAADKVPWMAEQLKSGWNVFYWMKSDPNTKEAATIKLETENSNIKYDDNYFPLYTFNYHGTNNAAQWHGNGPHVFQGCYAPSELAGNGDTPATWHSNITTDQHDETETAGSLGNYTLLSRCLAIGSECELSATISRISIPYKHRLSRVKLYVLIDPKVKNSDKSATAKIDGYQLVNGKDDPTTSKIRFSNVWVTGYMNQNQNHIYYDPYWYHEEGRIIPHSLGEFGSINNKGEEKAADCISFYDEDREVYIMPSNKDWQALYDLYKNDPTSTLPAYTPTNYGQVPCYDLIVRPTYTEEDSVMYDEDIYQQDGTIDVNKRRAIANLKNTFDVEATLNNGLTQRSTITVDLDANYQIAVYMIIDPERVNVDESKPVKWEEKTYNDDWYGLNNELGHSLSKAGSSWQRAYRIGFIDPVTGKPRDNCGADEITDGNFYNQETTTDDNGDGQYLTKEKWIEKFQAATVNGANHGDYFILDQDIELDGGITFTGHLDAQDHKITFTAPLTGLNGNYVTVQETTQGTPAANYQANVHNESGKWVPTLGYRAEILNAQIVGNNFLPLGTDGQYTSAVTGYVYNCRKAGTSPVQKFPDNKPAIPEY